MQTPPNPFYPPPPLEPKPPRRVKAWHILVIFLGLAMLYSFVSTALHQTSSSKTASTPISQPTATSVPTDTPEPTSPPQPTDTPEPQSVHDWHGTGTQKTEVFAMQGTWHVQWFCLGSGGPPDTDENQYLTINLYNTDTGKILKTWQHNCGTERYDEVVQYDGSFQIEGIVTKQTIEYHITVVQ